MPAELAPLPVDEAGLVLPSTSDINADHEIIFFPESRPGPSMAKRQPDMRAGGAAAEAAGAATQATGFEASECGVLRRLS